jgi:iron-sulfur cluster assembly protein CyaY
MPEPIDEARFDAVADRALRALEVGLNDVDGVEADLESGILSIEFEDGVRFIVNSHRAARQIWMAAGAQAWHFDFDAATEVWTAKKSGDELWSCIERQVGQKLGRPLELARR